MTILTTHISKPVITPVGKSTYPNPCRETSRKRIEGKEIVGIELEWLNNMGHKVRHLESGLM